MCMDSHSTSWHLGTTKPSCAKRNCLVTGAGKASNQIIADHLISLHVAWKAYEEQEASSKMRTALHRQTRTATALKCQCGDKVFHAVDKEKQVRGDTEVQGSSAKDLDSDDDDDDVYHRENANAAKENKAVDRETES